MIYHDECMVYHAKSYFTMALSLEIEEAHLAVLKEETCIITYPGKCINAMVLSLEKERELALL